MEKSRNRKLIIKKNYWLQEHTDEYGSNYWKIHFLVEKQENTVGDFDSVWAAYKESKKY